MNSLFEQHNKVAIDSWFYGANKLNAELIMGIASKTNGETYMFYDEQRPKENVIKFLRSLADGLENNGK